MLLLLLCGSASASAPPVVGPVVTAFQPNAFQSVAVNGRAFQILEPTTGRVGWFDEWDIGRRFRHDPAELERRLEAQQATSRQAIEALLRAEIEVKKPKIKRAIRQAVIAAIEVETEEPRLNEYLATATLVAHTSQALKKARLAERLALAIIAAQADEEEEELLLLCL